jgi:transposase InsO family protein
LVGVSRSGYYEWRDRGESVRDGANRILLVSIAAAYHESRQTYGAIRVHRELKDQGIVCGKNRVARLMQQNGIVSVHREKYRPQTTQSKHNFRIVENLMNQDFHASSINQKWGGDISYMPTDEGWLYLSVLLDFHSRKVVGSATGDSLHTS